MTMPSGAEITDPNAAVARFLKDECPGAEGRVFRPELPESEDSLMPRRAIVVFAGGGGHMMGNNRMDAFDSLIDIACYGGTRQEAEEVAREAMYALRQLGRQTVEGVLLHWARIAGGVKSALDVKTEWPFAIITVQVLHSLP